MLAQSVSASLVLDAYVRWISRNKLIPFHISAYLSHFGRSNYIVISVAFAYFFRRKWGLIVLITLLTRSNYFPFWLLSVIFSKFRVL